jgi:hypothetical protein
MGIETAGALGAEQMRGPHITLAQHQVQVSMHALGTGFADGAESYQAHKTAVVVRVVDHGNRVKFGQLEAVIGVLLAPALDREGSRLIGRRFKG